MIEVNALLFSVLVETTAVFGLMLILWPILSIRRRRIDRQRAGELAEAFRADREQREQSNRKMVAKLGALTGDRLQEALKLIERNEALVYENLITAYVRRDAAALEQIKPAMDGLLDRFYELEIKQPEPVPAGDPEKEQALRDRIKAKEATITRLEAENERLASDLANARRDIDSMMEEYSAMFEGGIHAQMRRQRSRDEAKHRLRDEHHPGAAAGEPEVEMDPTVVLDPGAAEPDLAAEAQAVEVDIDLDAEAGPPIDPADAALDGAEPEASEHLDADLAAEWAASLDDSEATADPAAVEAEHADADLAAEWAATLDETGESEAAAAAEPEHPDADLAAEWTDSLEDPGAPTAPEATAEAEHQDAGLADEWAELLGEDAPPEGEAVEDGEPVEDEFERALREAEARASNG